MTNSDGEIPNLGFGGKNSHYDPIYHTKLTAKIGKGAWFSVSGFVTPRTTGQSSHARSPSFPQSAQKVKAHCLSVSDINTTPAEVDIVGYDNGCQFQQCWCSSTFYNPILKLIIESWLGWVIYTRAGQFFMVIFYFVYWSNIKVFKWVWNWNFVMILYMNL